MTPYCVAPTERALRSSMCVPSSGTAGTPLPGGRLAEAAALAGGVFH